MQLPDVNVLLYAYDTTSRSHPAARRWLESALAEAAVVGFAPVVLLGFLRLATSARVYANPMPVPEAFDVVESWLQFPQAVMLEPGPRHLGIMRSLLEPIGTAANLTTDAHLGALAIEHNAELVSFDNDFARFPGVRWTMPTVP